MSELRDGRRDELLAPWLHRPIADRLARLLARTSITPTVVTAGAFVLTLGAAGLFWAGGEPVLMISAGLTLFAATILDCTDGSLARLQGAETRAGAWLDTILDRVGDSILVIAITAHQASTTSGEWPWLLGMSALATTTLASYGRKEYELRWRVPAPPTLPTRLARRDVRTVILVIGALALEPFAAVLVTGVIGLTALIALCAVVATSQDPNHTRV
jgi:phosphatidylglycerophosphate synthase